ncbi:MAG: peptidylprolyl isomerase [Candidatus Melainabacteria bacterium]|nr:peptidylprolyl isomerase [Candidatus Melainabacteria bacterium]
MNQSASQDSADPTCVLETSKGRIVIRLFQKYAPITVKAFTEMANSGFYNGLKFHRVEPGFVVQGGCPVGNGTGNYVPQGSNQPRFLPLEVSPFLKHNAPGVVAMARQPNDVNTSSCQFYITLNPQPSLDQKYTVIGGVLQGMDVVRSIAIGDRIVSVSVNP